MKIGAEVTGRYLGEFYFTGIVTAARPIYVKTDGCLQHEVHLNEPIIVYGGLKTSILMNTLPDGSPSSYTRYSCYMSESVNGDGL